MKIDIRKFEQLLSDAEQEQDDLYYVFSLVFTDQKIDFNKLTWEDISYTLDCFWRYVTMEEVCEEGETDHNPLHSYLRVFEFKESLRQAKSTQEEFCL